eukprot:g20821.t1
MQFYADDWHIFLAVAGLLRQAEGLRGAVLRELTTAIRPLDMGFVKLLALHLMRKHGGTAEDATNTKLPVVLKEGRTNLIESMHNKYDSHSRWHQGYNEDTRHATILRACWEVSEKRRTRISRGKHRHRAFELLQPLEGSPQLKLHGKWALPPLTNFARQRWRDWNSVIIMNIRILSGLEWSAQKI